METLVESLVGDSTGLLERKQDAERAYEQARADVERAQLALSRARADMVEARTLRAEARKEWDETMRATRKPRQKNIVRRILSSLEGYDNGRTRNEIIKATEIDATSVSTTLTRCKKAGFVSRDDVGFAGLWVITAEGLRWLNSEEPMPQ